MDWVSVCLNMSSWRNILSQTHTQTDTHTLPDKSTVEDVKELTFYFWKLASKGKESSIYPAFLTQNELV